MSARNLIRILFNTLLGVILILIWLHFINIQQIFSTIKTINPVVLPLFLLFFILATCFRSLRLKLLLSSYPLEFQELIFLNFISQFLSFIIPIRAGEIAKGVYMCNRLGSTGGARRGAPTSPRSDSEEVGWGCRATGPVDTRFFITTLLWVFIDRFLDFWVYILVVGLLVFLVPNNLPSQVRLLILGLVGGFSLAALLMIVANNLAQKLIKFSSKLLVIPKLEQLFSTTALQIVQAFSILNRPPRDILMFLGLSFLAVGSDLMTFLVVYLSFNPQIDILKVLLGSGLTVFTFLIPAAPGYIGSVEASNLAIFSGVVGFGPTLVSSVAVVFHILELIALPIFGIASIYFLKFDLGLVWRRLKRS